MPRQTYAAEQARIEKEISKLQKKRDALQTRQRKPILDSIVKSMRQYNLTPEDIAAAFGAKGSGRRTTRKAAPAASTGAKKPVAPKYRHPETGDTWSGRGKPPRWLAAAEEQGSTRESFLIAA